MYPSNRVIKRYEIVVFIGRKGAAYTVWGMTLILVNAVCVLDDTLLFIALHFHCVRAGKQVLLASCPSGGKRIFSFASCVCVCLRVFMCYSLFMASHRPWHVIYVMLAERSMLNCLISISTGVLSLLLQSRSSSHNAATQRAALGLHQVCD